MNFKIKIMDFTFLQKKYKVNIHLPTILCKNLYKNTGIEVLFYFSCPIKWHYTGLYGSIDYKTTYEFIVFKLDGFEELFCNHLIFNSAHYDFWDEYQCNSNIYSLLKVGNIDVLRVITHGGCNELPLKFNQSEKDIAFSFAKISNSKKHLDYFISHCL